MISLWRIHWRWSMGIVFALLLDRLTQLRTVLVLFVAHHTIVSLIRL
jgi:hypothetical protein